MTGRQDSAGSGAQWTRARDRWVAIDSSGVLRVHGAPPQPRCPASPPRRGHTQAVQRPNSIIQEQSVACGRGQGWAPGPGSPLPVSSPTPLQEQRTPQGCPGVLQGPVPLRELHMGVGCQQEVSEWRSQDRLHFPAPLARDAAMPAGPGVWHAPLSAARPRLAFQGLGPLTIPLCLPHLP